MEKNCLIMFLRYGAMLVYLGTLSNPLVALFGDGETDSLCLGEWDQRLVALADDEHIGQTGGKCVTYEQVKRARRTFLFHFINGLSYKSAELQINSQ